MKPLVIYHHPCSDGFGAAWAPRTVLGDDAEYIGEAGHRLAQESGTFGLVWHRSASGRVYVNLRSNGEYDVSEIAKAFGGGGHRNAAGYQVYAKEAWMWE